MAGRLGTKHDDSKIHVFTLETTTFVLSFESIIIYVGFGYGTDGQHPHPAAPKEVVDSFESIFARYGGSSSSAQSTSGGSSGSTGGASGGAGGPKKEDITGGAKSARAQSSQFYNQFWEAPEWTWKPRAMEMSAQEVESIMVSFICLLLSWKCVADSFHLGRVVVLASE